MKKLFENWRKYLNEETAAFHGWDMKPQEMNRKGELPTCEEPPEFGTGEQTTKNPEHGYYDNQWEAGEAGCPQFSDDKGIGLDHPDIQQAVEFLDNVRPSDLIAYSRGGAVALAALPLAAHAPRVTFVAPAWRRGWVTGIDNPTFSNGVIIHGTNDHIPLSHSAELSLRTGMDLYVFDGRNHTSILKDKLDPTSGRLLSQEEKEELVNRENETSV